MIVCVIVVEPLNLMFCEESEYSLAAAAAAADSGDENVMEGGLTIRQHQQYQRHDGSGRLPRVSRSFIKYR